MSIETSTVNLTGLVVGDCEFDTLTVKSGEGTIKKGQALALSSNTSDAGKYLKCDTSGDTDDQHIATAIAAEEVDATSADKNVRAIVSGRVMDAKLVFTASQTADSRNGASKSIRESLQDNGITIIDSTGGIFNE